MKEKTIFKIKFAKHNDQRNVIGGKELGPVRFKKEGPNLKRQNVSVGHMI